MWLKYLCLLNQNNTKSDANKQACDVSIMIMRDAMADGNHSPLPYLTQPWQKSPLWCGSWQVHSDLEGVPNQLARNPHGLRVSLQAVGPKHDISFREMNQSLFLGVEKMGSDDITRILGQSRIDVCCHPLVGHFLGSHFFSLCHELVCRGHPIGLWR